MQCVANQTNTYGHLGMPCGGANTPWGRSHHELIHSVQYCVANQATSNHGRQGCVANKARVKHTPLGHVEQCYDVDEEWTGGARLPRHRRPGMLGQVGRCAATNRPCQTVHQCVSMCRPAMRRRAAGLASLGPSAVCPGGRAHIHAAVWRGCPRARPLLPRPCLAAWRGLGQAHGLW